MNIFVLDRDPYAAASLHADIHLAKMVLEGAQMIATALHSLGHPATYKPTHRHHPCTKWVQQSRENILWLCTLMHGLDLERSRRMGFRFKPHKSLQLTASWLAGSVINSFPSNGLTPFVQAMPEKFRSDDAVASYRAYYASKAADMPLKYSNARTPEWLIKK